MNDIIFCKSIGQNGEIFRNESGEFLGGAVKMDDGFYCFVTPMQGIFTAHNLRCIADKLDQINKPWAEAVEDYMYRDER